MYFRRKYINRTPKTRVFLVIPEYVSAGQYMYNAVNHKTSSIVVDRLPWAPAEIFPEGGKIIDTLKSRHVFGAPYQKSTIFWRAEGANENFCVFIATF